MDYNKAARNVINTKKKINFPEGIDYSWNNPHHARSFNKIDDLYRQAMQSQKLLIDALDRMPLEATRAKMERKILEPILAAPGKVSEKADMIDALHNAGIYDPSAIARAFRTMKFPSGEDLLTALPKILRDDALTSNNPESIL